MNPSPVDAFDWIALVKGSGASAAPLLLGALFWLNKERLRLIDQLEKRDEQISALSERVLTVTTELKTFLFSERKAS